MNIVNLALNISIRALKLADRFGITQGSSNAAYYYPRGKPTEAVSRPCSEAYSLNAALGIPNYRWKLLRRFQDLESILNSQTDLFQSEKEDHLNVRGMQLMENGEGKKFLVDVAEVGMNIAEQLYKLECGNGTEGVKNPNDAFGWTIIEYECERPDISSENLVVVASPEKEAHFMLSEELIMDVALWIQATYLTSPLF